MKTRFVMIYVASNVLILAVTAWVRAKLKAEQELVDAGLKSSSPKPAVEVIVIRRKKEVE